MKAGFNYGLLFTTGGLMLLLMGSELVLWYSRRSERAERRGRPDGSDVAERLARAEAAIRDAEEEIASVRAELAAHR